MKSYKLQRQFRHSVTCMKHFVQKRGGYRFVIDITYGVPTIGKFIG